jgi:hypothetical protein
MNVIDAAHRTIHDYPGGSESLGPRIGMSPAVLRSKVNPNTSTHHLTLAEADRIMGVTGDFQILHALAANHGFVLSSVEREIACPLTAAILQAHAAHGELSGVVEVALRDGRISANEKADIEESALHAVSKLLAMVNALVAKAEPELRAVA